jgi:hypothetical protein
MSPSFFVFGVEYRYYGILFVTTFIIAYHLVHRMFARLGHEASSARMFYFTALVFCLVGMRLVHVVFYEWNRALADPFYLLKIWQGGSRVTGPSSGFCSVVSFSVRAATANSLFPGFGCTGHSHRAGSGFGPYRKFHERRDRGQSHRCAVGHDLSALSYASSPPHSTLRSGLCLIPARGSHLHRPLATIHKHGWKKPICRTPVYGLRGGLRRLSLRRRTPQRVSNPGARFSFDHGPISDAALFLSGMRSPLLGVAFQQRCASAIRDRSKNAIAAHQEIDGPHQIDRLVHAGSQALRPAQEWNIRGSFCPHGETWTAHPCVTRII